jgi:hypothetical protein
VFKILGVVKDVTPEPPNKGELPIEAEYQSIVTPVPAEAEITTIPGPQREPAVAVGAEGTSLTVATTEALVAEIQFVVVFLASA